MTRSTSEDAQETAVRDEVLATLRDELDAALVAKDRLQVIANDPALWDADRIALRTAADLQGHAADALEDRLRERNASR